MLNFEYHVQVNLYPIKNKKCDYKFRLDIDYQYFFRSPSRCASPFASHSGSRDVSPRPKSPRKKRNSGIRQMGNSPHGSCFGDDEDDLEDAELSGICAETELVEKAVMRYRVSVLGENDTGKTALVSQFLTSEYINTYDASLGQSDICRINLVFFDICNYCSNSCS